MILEEKGLTNNLSRYVNMYYRQYQQDGASEGCWHGAKESPERDGGGGGPAPVTDQAGHYPNTLYCSQKGKVTGLSFEDNSSKL